MDSNQELKEIIPNENAKKESHATETIDERQDVPTTAANIEPAATVKVILSPIGQVVTYAYQLKTTIQTIKKQFSADLKIPEKLLQVIDSTKKTILDANTNLSEMGVEANGTVQLEISSLDNVKYPIQGLKMNADYMLSPDVITVRVDLGNNQFKEIAVEVVRSNVKKPYMGGYKHKKLGIEFLNAATQTKKPVKLDNGIQKFCRDTQTIVSHHVKMQTYNDISTQMTKPGVFVSNIHDKLLQPKPYQTAAEKEHKIVDKVIIIQKYFRRWLAKKNFNTIKEAYLLRKQWDEEQELQRIAEIEHRRQNDINRRLNPRTKGDFEILYAALEKWKNEELIKINASKTGASRKAALALLLDQEAELIATIERYKIEASKECKEKEIQKLLEKMSAPKTWKFKDGTSTEVDSPYNIRARELKDIYNSLNMRYLTQDERLDVLLTLKHTVKEHDCKLTQEIIGLIDREADLLMRGVKEENLSGLRKRICTLYLQYIKTPQFNPAVAKHLKVPQDINDTTNESYYCTTCERYMPSFEFQISSTNSKVGKCKNCKHLENLTIRRTDYTKFKYLLLKIQNDEEIYGQNSRICYLLTDRDIQYIFENIWGNQSILSSINDVYQLHLVRWNKNEEWSPWNCILLTLEEAAAHLKLNNLDLNYGDPFIRKVKQKHIVARNYFSKLPGISEHMRKLELLGDVNFPSLNVTKIA